MSSTNSYGDSYPQMMPHMPWYQPNPERFPPQMGFDPTTKFPTVQGPWPYSAHAYPMPCNGCGNHMNFPGYFNNCLPPHPNFYHPQSCYYWGSHPGFFEPRPTCQGQTMPAPYTMDHPVFDGKNTGRLHHCCGCPNHDCNPKRGSSVKIEEHEPDIEKKAGYSSDGSNSLIPLNFKNYPYPIMWIPPNCKKNKDQSQGSPSRKGLNGAYEEDKPAGKFSLEKPKLNKWFPLEMHKKHPFMAQHDLNRETSKQREDEGRKFQCPFIWVPSWDIQNVEGKEKADSLLSSSKEAPFRGATNSLKNAQVRSVPPKDANAHLAEKSSPGNKQSGDAEDSNREKEVAKERDAQSVGRKQSLSPTKSSKLLPVCLRVDSLPKKKENGTENPRSVSPNEAERTGITEKQLKNNNAGDLSAENSIEEKIPKRTFSDVEAATLIQAAYRGYEVRRWDTMPKLKQMAGVQEGLIKIRDSVEELKSRNDSLSDTNKFERQRVVIGESIMSLLLKLDTIQGVHPSLRNIRKSLVRELVGLQEKLDSLVSQSSNAQKEEYEEGWAEKPGPEGNHTLAEDNAEADDTVDSSIIRPSQLVQEEKHEELNELDHGHLKKSEEDIASATTSDAKPLGAAATEPDTQQNVDLSALDVKGKEAYDDLNGLKGVDFVVESREDPKKQSSEPADYGQPSQCDQMSCVSVDIPSSGVAAAPQATETVMPAEETNTPSLSDAVEPSADIFQGDDAESKDSINAGRNDSEKKEDDRTKNADVSHDAEGDFCNQTDLRAPVEANRVSLDAVQMNVAEELAKEFTPKEHTLPSEHAAADEVDGETDSALDASVSVPSSAMLGDIAPENQLHEEERKEVGPSPQEEDASNVPLLPVPDHGVHENHPQEDRETISSLQEEDGHVNVPPDNNNTLGTAEVPEHDEGAGANVGAGHQPEGEAKPEQEEIRMKTSADDCRLAAVLGKIEDNVEIISDLEDEEILKEKVPNSPSTSGCEYRGEGVKNSEDGDATVALKEKPSVECNLSSVQPGDQVRQICPDSDVAIPGDSNEKLRLMMEKLMEVGKEQIDAIAKLTGRVRDLESKLARSKKKSRTRRCRTGAILPRMSNAKTTNSGVL